MTPLFIISFFILIAYFIFRLDRVYYKKPRWYLILSCLVVLLISYWIPGFTLLSLLTHEIGLLGQYCYTHRDVAIHWLTNSRVMYKGHLLTVPKDYKYLVHSYVLDEVLAYKELPVWDGSYWAGKDPLVITSLSCNYRSTSANSLMEINK